MKGLAHIKYSFALCLAQSWFQGIFALREPDLIPT